jgi:hypothetical protein
MDEPILKFASVLKPAPIAIGQGCSPGAKGGGGSFKAFFAKQKML